MSDIRIENFDVDKANGNTHTLTTPVGSLDNAFVKNINNTRKGSAGTIGNTGNQGPNDAAMAAELTAVDTITFRNIIGTQKMMGEVWEYTGSPGGANEFIVRGRVAVTVTTADLSKSAAISGIVSEADCVPFVSGYTSTETSNSDYEGSTFGVQMDGSGNVVVSRQAGNASQLVVYITVVEFTGSNWSVASGVSASHDASREEITLTSDHGDWGKAFIEATGEGDTSETGLADTMFLCYPGSATNTVWVDYQTGDNNARNDGTAYIYVISNPDMIVTRNGSNQAVSEGNNSYGTNLSFPGGANTGRTIDQLGLEWFCTTNGTGAAHARASIAARITDPTGTIRHWVHRTGNSILARYAVIDVSQVIDPGGGSTDVNTERDAEISGVDTDQASRSAEIAGRLDSDAERDALIDGTDTDQSERDAEIDGVDNANTERDAEVHGVDTDQSDRSAEIQGALTDVTERDGEISGQASDQEFRNAEIKGSNISDGERDALISGAFSAEVSRGALIDGRSDGPEWEIQRNDDGAGWIEIEAQIQIDETTGTYNYTDTGPLFNGVEYCYRVRSVSPVVSNWSNSDCFIYSGDGTFEAEIKGEITGTRVAYNCEIRPFTPFVKRDC